MQQGNFLERVLEISQKNGEIDFSIDFQYQIIKSSKIIINSDHYWIFEVIIVAASLFARKAK
jgi:hypothetical protein